MISKNGATWNVASSAAAFPHGSYQGRALANANLVKLESKTQRETENPSL